MRATAVLTALLGTTAGVAGTAVAATPAPVNNAAIAAHNPSGTFNLSVQGRTIRAYGTVADPEATNGVTIVFRFNGVTSALAVSNPHSYGQYSAQWTLPYRTWNVTAVAVNVGMGNANPTLGSKTVQLVNPATYNPRGSLSVAQSGSSVRVFGTAYDPEALWFRLGVNIYDNGRFVTSVRASSPWHVWYRDLRLTPGLHLIQARGLNVGRGTGNPILGSRWVRVPAPAIPVWQAAYNGNQRIAASLLASYGWDASQMAPLVALWNRESGWNPSAANSSGAYGIPQALPGSKMATAGADWQSNPATQIRWGLGYIKGIYGSPAAAWAHSQATGWY